MQKSADTKFVVDLLNTLRQDGFSASAWGRFFQRSWLMSWQTAHENPALEHSWRRVTGFILCLSLLILVGDGLMAGYADALRLLPGFAFCVFWQQSDLFWHLGLNRSTRSGELLPHIGLANTLTWLRALGASYLLGRLAGGLVVPSWLALTVFLCGIITDILDGYIARSTGTQSKLGQIADAEADFCLYLSLTIILLQNGVLPLWVGIVMLLRFVVPLVAALLSYMAFAHPVRFGSTVWGKYAGLVQCCYFFLLLVPLPHFTFFSLLNGLVLIVMLCLLVIAPVAQFFTNVKVHADV
jgi:phosphatidylglycerophosphate synthase